MKVRKIIFALCVFFMLVISCNSTNKKAISNSGDAKIKATNDIVDNTKKGENITSPQLGLSQQKKQEIIREKFRISDSLKVLKFEEFDNEYNDYEYTFLILDSSKYHEKYKRRVTLNLEKALKYSHYGNTKDWIITEDTLINKIKSIKPKWIKTWIPVHYYHGEKVLYDPAGFHGGYYHFTDSLIYDYSFMDGPNIYKYLSFETSDTNFERVTFTDILEEKPKTIEFYFIEEEFVIIKHYSKYLGDEIGFILAVPLDNIYQYQLITNESSEQPEGIVLDRINYDSIFNSIK